VLAASNDFGAAGVTPAGIGYLHPVVWWPASDPLVTGVGGTRLHLNNPALYRLEQEHAPGLVDVTTGSNTISFTQHGKIITIKGYQARPGYDLVTGIGTIDAARFVPELARTG
jgi:subtilase family serine protease